MTTAASALLVSVIAVTAHAQTLAPRERLCDPTFEDCRADILTYIQQETQQIDIAFWMMSDARYSNALIAARDRGVIVRVLMDPRCAGSHPACVPPMDQLAAGRIPMRYRTAGGILHWKMILFASQGQVEFSGANFVPFETTPHIPWVNFTDEIIYFSNDPAVVRSMMTRFDDLWTSTTEFANYANVTAPLTRSYPTYPIDPELNFPPDDSYRWRAVPAYDAEQQKIDVLMFRITDLNHTRAMIRAVNRGVPVRLLTDHEEYRNPNRLWHAYNVDMMYRAGVQVRLDGHDGINHAKGVLLYGSGMSIFGSSNWTSPSSDSQREHNYFTVKPAVFSWLAALFERKWNNSSGHAETKPFVPLPPGVPAPFAPANGSSNVATSGVVLQWNGGLWAHIYDIYFGTSPSPPLLAANRELGPSQYSTNYRQFAIGATLQPGTTYYWKIVSKTMAHVAEPGPVWRFTTAGTQEPPDPPALPAGWNSTDVGSTGAAGSASSTAGTFTVTGAGADVWGTSDQFHYAYTTLSGDGSIVARVASIQNVHAWTKAGVMIRNSLSPSASHAFQLVAASSSKGVQLQRRPLEGGSSLGSSGSASTAPRWVRLVRAGNLITGYESADGVSWITVGSDTFAMAPTVLIGLAVSSHVTGVSATAAFDNVSITTSNVPPPNRPPTVSLTSPAAGAAFTAPATIAMVATASDSDGTIARVEFYQGTSLLGTDASAPYQYSWQGVAAGSYQLTAVARDNAGAAATSSSVSIVVNNAAPPAGLPSGWAHADIGATPFDGDATHGSGVFTVTGSGADIWGSADAFHYAFRSLTGDGTIVARVASIQQGVNSWVKAGVMVRASLSADSPHAFMLASAAKGMAFQRRTVAGNATTNSAGTFSSAPRWVKLQRTGAVFSAYESANGLSWTLVGSESITMGATVYVGLAVTSHTSGASATCSFDNVSVQ